MSYQSERRENYHSKNNINIFHVSFDSYIKKKKTEKQLVGELEKV